MSDADSGGPAQTPSYLQEKGEIVVTETMADAGAGVLSEALCFGRDPGDYWALARQVFLSMAVVQKGNM